GLLRWRGGAIATVGHELIELGLVLGGAQPLQEFAELALLLFEPAQSLGAIFIEGMIAARWTGPAAAMTEALHLVAHAVHLGLPAIHLGFETVVTASAPASHPSAP